MQHGSHLLRDGAEGFEDGTVSFLDFDAVIAGSTSSTASGCRASGGTSAIARRALVERLRALTHADGSPMIRLYGPRDRYDCGGTVAFNVLDATRRGRVRTRWSRSTRAAPAISVRGGCFCNPGASEAAFGFVADRAAKCIAETRRAGWSLREFARG